MLLIDSHEPADIVQALQAKMPVKVLVLKYGDYSFSDAIIERKTLSDFFLSLKNKRLEYQMESISRLYTHKYLIIEGFFDFSYVNNVSHLYSRLASIMLDFDVKIIFSQDIKQTICLLKRIYSLKNMGYILNISRKDKAYHAAKLFGISQKRLEILFSHFGSINNIANAHKKEFKGIKHIGKKTIEKVKNALETDIFEFERLHPKNPFGVAIAHI